MTTTVETLIVGGGICGLATALSVASSGRPVHLLEQADQFSEIGAGLQFGPNASRVLDQLGVLDDILPLAVRPQNAVMMDALSGTALTTLELGQAFERRYGYPYLVLHRHDLLDVLLEHCQQNSLITLETRRKVVSADIGPEISTVCCADGTRYAAAVLLAADGLNSVLRQHVVQDEPQCSGYAAYRGTMPTDQATHVVSPNDVVLWIGPGIHLMQYPVRRGELYNQVAVFGSPRYRAGHIEDGQWGGPDELDAAFAGACAVVRDAVAVIGRERFWPMFDRRPVPTWTSHTLLLVGDAAHPMLQYLGQGACQALEDAVELGSQFRSHTTNGYLNVPAAYRAFEQTRLPQASRCQTSARPWGEMWHTADKLTIALRDRLLAQRRPDDFGELDWLYAAPGCPATA